MKASSAADPAANNETLKLCCYKAGPRKRERLSEADLLAVVLFCAGHCLGVYPEPVVGAPAGVQHHRLEIHTDLTKRAGEGSGRVTRFG